MARKERLVTHGVTWVDQQKIAVPICSTNKSCEMVLITGFGAMYIGIPLKIPLSELLRQ